MMVCSLKLNKKVLIFALIGLIVLIGVLIIAFGGGTAGGEPETDVPQADQSAATPQERLAFIAQFGWEVDESSCESMNLFIPEEFDAVLERYNAVQKNQGYDLSAYRGRKVERYTYIVTNYPDTEDTVYINLIVCDGQVIGGDVCCRTLGGFMHGFTPNRLTLTVESEAADLTGLTVSEPAAETAAGLEEIGGPSD